MDINFKPSDVHLDDALPLLDTFSKLELEYTAAVFVLTLQHGGFGWDHPISIDEVVSTLEYENHNRAWLRNPFYKPDTERFVASGFAVRDANGRFVLTPLALDKLRVHVKPTT